MQSDSPPVPEGAGGTGSEVPSYSQPDRLPPPEAASCPDQENAQRLACSFYMRTGTCAYGEGPGVTTTECAIGGARRGVCPALAHPRGGHPNPTGDKCKYDHPQDRKPPELNRWAARPWPSSHRAPCNPADTRPVVTHSPLPSAATHPHTQPCALRPRSQGYPLRPEEAECSFYARQVPPQGGGA